MDSHKILSSWSPMKPPRIAGMAVDLSSVTKIEKPSSKESKKIKKRLWTGLKSGKRSDNFMIAPMGLNLRLQNRYHKL